MRLVEFIQRHLVDAPLGGALRKPRAKSAGDAVAYDDLRRVQATKETYFRTYWITLIVVFIATIAVALLYREEMGGLAAVLATGGVVQGGLIVRLSNEWKEKARIDIVAVLTRRLSEEQLQVVLQELLVQIRK